MSALDPSGRLGLDTERQRRVRLKDIFGRLRNGSKPQSGTGTNSSHTSVLKEPVSLQSHEQCDNKALDQGRTATQSIPNASLYLQGIDSYETFPRGQAAVQPIPDASSHTQLEQLEQFHHIPLDDNKPSIRLIRVLPGAKLLGHIRCVLEHTLIYSRPYTCLSYEWGPEPGGTMILLNDKPMYVRPNLGAFLLQASKRYHSVDLWIDALCIDQENFQERNHQVRQMGLIYSTAEEVLAWLGDDEIAASILSAFSRPLYLRGGNGMHQNDKGSIMSIEQKGAYISKNTYWSRAWITQEVSLARRVSLLAGDRAVSEHVLPERTKALIPHFAGVRHIGAHTENLLALLYKYRRQKCHIRRDIVYCLLALCYDGHKVIVDYTMADEEVNLAIVRACSKYLCLCTPLLLRNTLGIDRLVTTRHEAILLRNVSYQCVDSTVLSMPVDGSQTIHRSRKPSCSRCSKTLFNFPDFTKGYVACLKSLCFNNNEHFFWTRCEDRYSYFCVLESTETRSRNVIDFPAWDQQMKVSYDSVQVTCDILLPLYLYMALSPVRNTSATPHLPKQEQYISLWTSKDNLPPGPLIQVL